MDSTRTNLNCTGGKLEDWAITTISVLTAMFSAAAIAGNTLVLIAIYRSPHLRVVSNFFLASLAMADLFVGLVIDPVLIAKTVKNVNSFDKNPLAIAAVVLSIQSVTATVYNLSVVSIDRYFAITVVFRYTEIITPRRCALTIAAVWVLSIFFGFSRFFVTDDKDLPVLWSAASVVTFIIPFCVIAFCYYKIFRVAKTQSRRIVAANTLSSQQWRQSKRDRKAAYTVAIIIGIFLAFFFPNLVLSSLQNSTTDECYKQRLDYYYFWFTILNFGGSALNPWIYGLRNRDFRNAFRKMLGFRSTHSQDTCQSSWSHGNHLGVSASERKISNRSQIDASGMVVQDI